MVFLYCFFFLGGAEVIPKLEFYIQVMFTVICVGEDMCVHSHTQACML